MSPEAQRTAIAKACGWTQSGIWKNFWTSPSGEEFQEESGVPIPDYLNDLNAMHEAERNLSSTQCAAYRDILEQNSAIYGDMDGGCIDWQLVHATAAQRAEAFLRTLDLWEDDK